MTVTSQCDDAGRRPDVPWRPAGTSADPGERELPIRGGQSDGSEQSEDAGTTAKHGPYLLDLRELDGPDKHPTIHRMFDDLGPGQALTIVNDHQPKPLYYELTAG